RARFREAEKEQLALESAASRKSLNFHARSPSAARGPAFFAKGEPRAGGEAASSCALRAAIFAATVSAWPEWRGRGSGAERQTSRAVRGSPAAAASSASSAIRFRASACTNRWQDGQARKLAGSSVPQPAQAPAAAGAPLVTMRARRGRPSAPLPRDGDR